MTGENVLLIVELAILRVRDKQIQTVPQDMNMISVLDGIAREIVAIQKEWRDTEREEAINYSQELIAKAIRRSDQSSHD